MDAKLAKKIYDIMCATESLQKDLNVGTGNSSYKAIGEASVLNMLKPLFKQHKLICIPKDGSIEENILTYVDGYGKNKLRAITQLKVCFMLVDIETGESVDIVGFGNGADSQDKGSGKAWTYAYKSLLQKTFCLFSGEDTDNTHSDDIGKDIEKEQLKVTTAQLKEVLGDNEQATIEHYNNKTGKNITELKFMAQDYKQIYYKKAKEKSNVEDASTQWRKAESAGQTEQGQAHRRVLPRGLAR